MELSLRKYLAWSAAGHLAASVALVTSPYLPFAKFRMRPERIVWVELPKGTTGDLGLLKKTLGLPRTTIEEQKKALQQPIEKKKKPEMTYTQPKEREKPKTLTDEEKRMREALARVGKDVTARRPAPPEAAQIPETRPGGFPFGTSARMTVPPTDPEYVIYQAKIRQRIMDQWILPLKFADPALGLLCRINVHINERGEVIETSWDQPSGNPVFDLAAMRAIEKAAPLDPPPERLKWEAVNEGFLVEFKPVVASQ